MIDLRAFPADVFLLIIERLVVAVGIQRAVLLRTVGRAFDAAILHAICVSQVVDIDDPATPDLACRMAPTLRGKIVAAKSRSAYATRPSYLSVVATVNRALDTLTDEAGEELIKSRHESIAGAVNLVDRDRVDAQVGAQNILSGAAIIGDLSVLKSLLERNESSPALADVNGVTPYFYSPLALAAARGHLGIVRHLLLCGARLDSGPVGPWKGYENFAQQADWNGQDEGPQLGTLYQRPHSALHAAVLGGHAAVVHLLLHPRHRLPTTSLEYLRAILAGATAGRLDLIGTLFQAIGKSLSDFERLGKIMMWAAVRHNRKEVVQMLLDSGVDVNAFPDRACRRYHGTLQIAASLGNVRMVRFLIERGAQVTFQRSSRRLGDLPIEAASLGGQEEVVELLIEHGADPAAALIGAARGGQPRLIRALLSRFPDLPSRDEGEVGRLALEHALHVGSLTAITALVDAGVSLNYGYAHPCQLPLNVAKRGFGPWVVDHLILLGAQETDTEAYTERTACTAREILVSQRTWEWVSKY